MEAILGEYFIPAYPPFSAWSQGQIADLENSLDQKSSEDPLAIYVHVPFCVSKCDFCNNLSYVGARENVMHSYVDAVEKEAALYGRRRAIRDRTISSVYFGGGTPTALSVDQADRLIRGIQFWIPSRNVREVTFECAPRSVRAHFLESLRKNGVTRMSMGVQSFNNILLKLNGRIHYADDILRAFRTIRDIGFDSVNLDLMAGLLGETEADWQDTVRRTIEIAPDSVTIYQMEIPRNTQLYRDYAEDRLPTELVSWDVKHARVEYAFSEFEKSGYTITSAYTVVKDSRLHRSIYEDHVWSGRDLLGLGVSSFSYLGGVHSQNDVTLESYESELQQEKLPLKRAYKLNQIDQFVREFVLRLKSGRILFESIRKTHMDPLDHFAEPLRALENEGFLKISDSNVSLTREGLVRIDRLLPRFFAPEFRSLWNS
ncbi:MAG: coproporphyrinogen-III oxidase family protein [Verrucomicrobia bacterium]|nr:coproporphyrinogen-III oxidase family protein [Verrucomicrobiota bacterium]